MPGRAKRRLPQPPQASKLITNAPSGLEPVTFIEQLKDGISYGVRAYGPNPSANTAEAMAQYLRVKHFVEVELPQVTERNRAELLRVSAEGKK